MYLYISILCRKEEYFVCVCEYKNQNMKSCSVCVCMFQWEFVAAGMTKPLVFFVCSCLLSKQLQDEDS